MEGLSMIMRNTLDLFSHAIELSYYAVVKTYNLRLREYLNICTLTRFV